MVRENAYVHTPRRRGTRWVWGFTWRSAVNQEPLSPHTRSTYSPDPPPLTDGEPRCTRSSMHTFRRPRAKRSGKPQPRVHTLATTATARHTAPSQPAARGCAHYLIVPSATLAAVDTFLYDRTSEWLVQGENTRSDHSTNPKSKLMRVGLQHSQ